MLYPKNLIEHIEKEIIENRNYVKEKYVQIKEKPIY